MSAPNYVVRDFDLATARERTRIIEQGINIDAVSVLAMPAGATPKLHFGENRDGITVQAGFNFDISAEGPDGCPEPLNEGLFLTNPAGAGTLTLLISSGSVRLGAS